jgi:hypothetical protein
MIELTEQQRHALRNGEAIRVAAPDIGEDVVLLSATLYQKGVTARPLRRQGEESLTGDEFALRV